MSRNYESIIVLDSQGQTESVDEMISKIGKEMEGEGAKLGKVDHIGQRKFPTAPKGVSGGYFVNIEFSAEPDVISKVQEKLALNTTIYQQHYQRLA